MNYDGVVEKSETAAPVTIDARGHRCPVPTLKLVKALRTTAPGAIVRLLADDPLAEIDVPHFAASRGVEVVRIDRSPAGLSFLLRAPAAEEDAARRGNDAPPGVVSSS